METREPIQPVVQAEEEVYTYEPADNGAGPMWCYGSTCLVRIGDNVFASGLETLADFKPLNNVRWMLFKREPGGWELQQVDETGRTREPCPIAGFPDGRLFLSNNPTLSTDPEERAGPARPEILQFAAANPKAPPEKLLPAWDGAPDFREHSYRTFAADGPGRELILFQNIGYTHSEWALLKSDGEWIAGRLNWPEREDTSIAPYNSKWARINYPNVVLKDRAVYFFGAASYNKWRRSHLMPKHGPGAETLKWGPRWRRLYYTWTPDITAEPFRDWMPIADSFDDGGWVFPGDMWAAPDGTVHLVWSKNAIHEGLRNKYAPDIKRTCALTYATLRDGKVATCRTLIEGGEVISGEIPGGMGGVRLHVTPGNRLFAFYYVGGMDPIYSWPISDNRIVELYPDGSAGAPVRVPLKHPLCRFFTATPRGGSAPSTTLDLFGICTGIRHTDRTTMRYARIGMGCASVGSKPSSS